MKSKKILFITSNSEQTVAWQEREAYIRSFCEGVEDALKDVRVLYTTYDDLEFTVRGGESSIQDVRNKVDLRDYTFVHFKNWQYETEEATVAAGYLKAHHVPFYNTEVDMPVASGKLAQMFRLSEAGVPVPDSFYAHRSILLDLFAESRLPFGFTFPVIMKANDGSRGDDNHLVHSFEEARAALVQIPAHKEVILQNFIANNGDYRILFIGLESDPIIFLRTAVAGSHLNNTSKGGTGLFVDVASLPTDYMRYARKAAEVLRREIGG